MSDHGVVQHQLVFVSPDMMKDKAGSYVVTHLDDERARIVRLPLSDDSHEWKDTRRGFDAAVESGVITPKWADDGSPVWGY